MQSLTPEMVQSPESIVWQCVGYMALLTIPPFSTENVSGGYLGPVSSLWTHVGSFCMTCHVTDPLTDNRLGTKSRVYYLAMGRLHGTPYNSPILN